MLGSVLDGAKAGYRRLAALPLIVLAMGLAVTGILSWQAHKIAAEKDRERFNHAVEQTIDAIKDETNTYIALLRGVAGYLTAADAISKEDFKAYVERLRAQEFYPGVQGIGFSKFVKAGEEASLSQRLGREGVTVRPASEAERSFEFWASGSAPERHAIIYLEPLDRRNHAAIGYNMYSEPVRREAMSRARDRGGPAASGRVTLVQEIDARKQAGFLIYVPVYAGGSAPATVAARRGQLLGFAYSPFRADDLLSAVFRGHSHPRVYFEAYDKQIRPESLLHRSANTRNEPGALSAVRDVDIAGRTWKIVLATTERFEASSAKGFVPYIFFGGIVLSLAFSALTGRESRARQLAEQAARQISETSGELSATAAKNKAILEGAIDAIVTIDAKGLVTEFNPAAQKLFGYDREETIGKELSQLIIPLSYGEAHRNGVSRYLRTGEARILNQRLELPARRKTGEEFPVELTITRNPGAGEPSFTGFVRDVSELRMTERRLKEESAAIEAINRVGGSLAGEIELKKLVQSVTDACTELTEAECGAFFYNRRDEQGESYLLLTVSGVGREAFAKVAMPRNTSLFSPTFAGEGVVRLDDVQKDPRYGHSAPYFGLPPGHPPVTSYLAAPVVSRSGEVMGGLFFGHRKEAVFTERHAKIVAGIATQAAIAIDNARLYEGQKQALEQAEAANSELEQAARLKDEFLGTLSHELRTPLNAILGFASFLRMSGANGHDAKDALETIERNARVQARLIEDLLDMNRIISGKLRLDVQPLDLGEVIEAAFSTVRPSADSKGIRLEKQLDPRVGIVRADPNRLQQVVWNLLSNAIKFTPRGGRVAVALERVDAHIEISVVDTGQGIAPEFLPHVFERFSQADGSTTRRHGGLGLGLSIVRQLVELHGGSVCATSAGLGSGATFVVTLPVDAAPLAPGESQRPDPAPGGDVSDAAGQAVSLEGLSILVVDDDPDACALVKRILVGWKAEVETARSAPEAFDRVRTQQPDVLISDISMPGEDGYDLIRRVRGLDREAGGAIPAVALTAFARAEDRARAVREGFQAHVAKPVEPSALVAIVASLAGRAGDQ